MNMKPPYLPTFAILLLPVAALLAAIEFFAVPTFIYMGVALYCFAVYLMTGEFSPLEKLCGEKIPTINFVAEYSATIGLSFVAMFFFQIVTLQASASWISYLALFATSLFVLCSLFITTQTYFKIGQKPTSYV